MRYVSKRYKKRISRLYQIARQNDLSLLFFIGRLKSKSEPRAVRPSRRQTKGAAKGILTNTPICPHVDESDSLEIGI